MHNRYKDTIIGSVSDYLLWLKETSVADVMGNEGSLLSFELSDIYYRGQSCSDWELKPSLLREYPYLDEHSLLVKASLRFWNEISSLNSYVEKMIFFQHYGLITRLLDVTFNPLVALYMACRDEVHDFDGVVFCGYRESAKNPRVAELTAKYVFNHELENVVFDFNCFIEDANVKISDFFEPIFIQPPFNNPRIDAQNGAFIMSPLLSEVIDENKYLINRNGLDNSDFFDNRRAIVPKMMKEHVIHELSILGIDSGSIFKGIEERMKAIVREEKWKSNKFKNIQI